jgi:hypothetical protein
MLEWFQRIHGLRYAVRQFLSLKPIVRRLMEPACATYDLATAHLVVLWALDSSASHGYNLGQNSNNDR